MLRLAFYATKARAVREMKQTGLPGRFAVKISRIRAFALV
jgi:hypothetical protein